MSEIAEIQLAAARALAICKCGSYPQCQDCIMRRLVMRLTDAMSTREPTTATGRIQRHAVEAAAQELQAHKKATA